MNCEAKTNSNPLDGLAVGDVVQLTRTLRVVGSDQLRRHASVDDVRSGEAFYLTHREFLEGSSKLTMVKKVAPPKPSEGEVITAHRLIETQWKRGTTVRYGISDGRTVIATLQESGEWQATDCQGNNWAWGFDAMGGVEKFELLHVA